MSIFTGSMVAIVTPMKEGGEIDFKSLEKLIEFHISSGTDAIVSVGTTGESATLDFEEHSAVVQKTIEIVSKRIPVIAGTGANSTQEAVELTKSAQKLNADGCLLVTPYYNKPTQEGLYRHYMRIADEVDIPQILYNVPGRTSVDMLPETVEKLSTHTNIVGIKEASGNSERSKRLIDLCSNNISIYTGDDATSMTDMIDGFKGNISVTANVVPSLMHQMCSLSIKGNKIEAAKINNKIKILHEKLFCESNPIPVKYCLYKMGYIDKGIRLPLTWLDKCYYDEVDAILSNLELI